MMGAHPTGGRNTGGWFWLERAGLVVRCYFFCLFSSVYRENSVTLAKIIQLEDTIMITQENFDSQYADPIEVQQIRKFVCNEISRQIHRYIKGMSGSHKTMLKFEESLKDMTLDEKERQIAAYIDLNRHCLDGLDMKMVLVRAMANYCDTFAYMMEMVKDRHKWGYYLKLIRDSYFRYHEIFEENGHYGIRDHEGRVLVSPQYDFLRTPYVYVDDIRKIPVIAQKDGKMGLVLADGHDTVVAPFKYDDISLRDEEPYFVARLGDRTVLLDTAPRGREE